METFDIFVPKGISHSMSKETIQKLEESLTVNFIEELGKRMASANTFERKWLEQNIDTTNYYESAFVRSILQIASDLLSKNKLRHQSKIELDNAEKALIIQKYVNPMVGQASLKI